MQGGGVEGIGEKFIFCHVSNFRYFQLKIKMPFVYVIPYVCQLFRKKNIHFCFHTPFNVNCQLSHY